MVRLVHGSTDHFSFTEGSDDPELYPLLSDARGELESTLKEIAEAARNGDVEEDHSVADYFLHDTKTNRTYDVAWGPEKADLLVRISHQDALSKLVEALAQPDAAGADHEFHLDVAKTALEFGLVDHRNTVAIVLPSQDGPRSDKHTLAPSSMGGALALAFVNEACTSANDLQEAIDTGGVDDDGMSVSERIDAYLEEAGFTVLSGDDGNLRVTQAWDYHEARILDEPSSAPAP